MWITIWHMDYQKLGAKIAYIKEGRDVNIIKTINFKIYCVFAAPCH